jgi:hypothetical protein
MNAKENVLKFDWRKIETKGAVLKLTNPAMKHATFTMSQHSYTHNSRKRVLEKELNA